MFSFKIMKPSFEIDLTSAAASFNPLEIVQIILSISLNFSKFCFTLSRIKLRVKIVLTFIELILDPNIGIAALTIFKSFALSQTAIIALSASSVMNRFFSLAFLIKSGKILSIWWSSHLPRLLKQWPIVIKAVLDN